MQKGPIPKTLTHNDLVLEVRKTIAPAEGKLPMPHYITDPDAVEVEQFLGALRGDLGAKVNAFLAGVKLQRGRIMDSITSEFGTRLTKGDLDTIAAGEPAMILELGGGVKIGLHGGERLMVSTNLRADGSTYELMHPTAPANDSRLVQNLRAKGITRGKLADRLLAESDKLESNLHYRETTYPSEIGERLDGLGSGTSTR